MVRLKNSPRKRVRNAPMQAVITRIAADCPVSAEHEVQMRQISDVAVLTI
jgi:hypothetical protein